MRCVDFRNHARRNHVRRNHARRNHPRRNHARHCGTSTHSVTVRYPLHLLEVLGLGQQAQPLGEELAAGRVEGLPVRFAQLGAKGVQSDDKSAPVSLKLKLQDIRVSEIEPATKCSRQIHFQNHLPSFQSMASYNVDMCYSCSQSLFLSRSNSAGQRRSSEQ